MNRSALHLVLINILINDLEDGIDTILIKAVDITKLGGTADKVDDSLRMSNDHDKLEIQSGKKHHAAQKGPAQGIALGWQHSTTRIQSGLQQLK